MRLHYLFFCICAATASLAAAAPSASSAKSSKPTKSKLVTIGEIESVTLVKEKLSLLARIDTGAQTSSLSAQKIERYERDGKKWVRFEVNHPSIKKPILVERKLSRVVEIKRHGAPPAKRPVVLMTISMGEILCQCEFSLVDRSSYEFPLLIGRNFLSGRAVVDVSVKHAAHPMNKGDKK